MKRNVFGENFDYENVVDYDTAKRISKLGIRWQASLYKRLGYHYYNSEGILDGDSLEEIRAYTDKDLTRDQRRKMIHITAPTYSQILSFFLRKGFFLIFVPYAYEDEINWSWRIIDMRDKESSGLTTDFNGDGNDYPEFNKAIDAAINKMLDIFEENEWYESNNDIEDRLDRIEERIQKQ